MKKSEMFVELQVELAKVNAKLDKVLEMLLKDGNMTTDQTSIFMQDYRDRLSDYALKHGNFVDAGIVQVWREKLNDSDLEEQTLNAEEIVWSYIFYGYLVEFGIFANIFMWQTVGGLY